VVDTARFIFDIGFVLLLAALAGWVARRIGLPDVIGYLIVGIAVSPSTPGFVADRTEIAVIADIGVVLLLFEVGLELDLAKVRAHAGAVMWASPVQVVLTTVVAGALTGYVLGLSPAVAGIVGLAVATSSSAVIASIAGGETGSDRALSTAIGWSGVQDIVTVILAAVLFSVDGIADLPLPLAIAGLLAYGLAVVVFARVLPAFLRVFIDNEEAFLLISFATAITLAGLGAMVFAVPVALAAFLAGLAIRESEETRELHRRLVPFRSVFAVFFFVSIGFFFDSTRIFAAAPIVALLIGCVVGVKCIFVWAVARTTRLPGKSLHVSVALGQMGEFAFVLGSAMVAQGQISDDLYAAIIASVALTIGASTVLYQVLRTSTRRPGRGHAHETAAAVDAASGI
jgi:CPA2 family monovalent cation:H+ antiporter-2